VAPKRRSTSAKISLAFAHCTVPTAATSEFLIEVVQREFRPISRPVRLMAAPSAQDGFSAAMAGLLKLPAPTHRLAAEPAGGSTATRWRIARYPGIYIKRLPS